MGLVPRGSLGERPVPVETLFRLALEVSQIVPAKQGERGVQGLGL